MLDDILITSTFLASLGSGLIAGAFFVFSSSILPALSRLPPPEGILAMQTITGTMKGPLFILAFFATAIFAAGLGIVAPLIWSEPAAPYLLAGSLLFINGPFGLTLLKNLPLNNKLARVKPDSESGAAVWDEFLPSWRTWNHVRTVTSLAAAACFTMALVEGGASFPPRN
jgi:uncharacterized membrane protein